MKLRIKIKNNKNYIYRNKMICNMSYVIIKELNKI